MENPIISKLEQLLDVEKATASRIYEVFLDSLVEVLSEEGEITLREFGRFSTFTRKGRNYYHRYTKKNRTSEPKQALKFTPSRTLVKGLQ